MNSLDKLRRFIPFLLRTPLGLIFLFFGIDKFLAPKATLVIIQASMFASLFPAGNAMIYLIGAVETIVGVLLICNTQIRKTALLAALLLLNISIIAQIPQDIVLLCVALAIAVLGNDNPWKK
ncbi:DoxX family membrane protein [Candidatus Woesearchaeota archaeon]|nr:DoxX family membrane protein [Candidatus Woesearchaeota archaeon]